MENCTVEATPAVHNPKTCPVADCIDCGRVPDAPDWVSSTADELRELANWHEKRGMKDNALFLNRAANQLEILAGAYETAKSQLVGV